jgi:hypothetical protein
MDFVSCLTKKKKTKKKDYLSEGKAITSESGIDASYRDVTRVQKLS